MKLPDVKGVIAASAFRRFSAVTHTVMTVLRLSYASFLPLIPTDTIYRSGNRKWAEIRQGIDTSTAV